MAQSKEPSTYGEVISPERTRPTIECCWLIADWAGAQSGTWYLQPRYWTLYTWRCYGVA